ncbi:MAG: radical SAM protein [Candidatus Nanoarchaeia archaeon]|nr:radical SAM protein [Candidatus Nanoarchaeia archaeon]MDD5358132.1 radical SAM protein [Candidatus Nanoarchaeia archaeon]MDD5589319.1 radical SAM protein [Candidatus Nanoarchaeia archaeon]
MNHFQILLVVPRYNYTTRANFSYNFPLGLAYISAVLKKAGYNLDIINLNHHEGTIEQLIQNALEKKQYDFVCTGNNTLGFSVIEKIINIVKNHNSKPKLILGGPIVTSEPELMIKLLKPDIGVIGEGEATILDLLKCFETNGDLNKIKGIVYLDKEGNAIITEKREFIEDIDSIPYPDFGGLEFEKFVGNNFCNSNYIYNCLDYPRTYPLLASRGCPFSCSFCWHSEKNRKRSIKNIMKELEFAIEHYKINNILIYDDCFSATKDRVYEFCKELKKLSKKFNQEIKWTCQLMVFSVDYDLLRTMKDAGVETISYGFESFSPAVLRSMRKPITPEQIDKTFHDTLKAGIGVQANFIFGDVAETNETAKETLSWWEKNAPGQVGLGFIKPYPGSEIYNHCIRKGIIKNKEDFIRNQISTDHWFNMTDNMTDGEVEKLKRDILDSMAKYQKFVQPITMKKTKKEIYDFTIKCPHCNELITYKNCFVKNRFTYGFNLVCRNCHMRFFVVSAMQKFAYQHYSKIRGLRDYQKKFIENFNKKKV